ncbi:MAG: hypothetical protein ACRC2H_00920 [Silanimonas sp.]
MTAAPCHRPSASAAHRLRAPGLAFARVACLVLAALLLAACGGEPAAPTASADAAPASSEDGVPATAIERLPQGSLEAVALELGVALDADGRVATVVERVRANDAVHVSLVTVGEAEAAMVAVAWRDAAGADIDADERAITAAGSAVHTFTRKPENGWAPGRYEVEVTVDGESAGVRRFEVR